MPATAPPQPITLVTGTDDLLVSRAISAVVAAARGADPMAEVNDHGPGQFAADDVLTLNNPSLFGGWRVFVVRGVQDLAEEITSALMAYVQAPAPEVALVLTATGRPSALVNALRKLKVTEVKAAPITQPGSVPSSPPRKRAATAAGSPTTPPGCWSKPSAAISGRSRARSSS